MSPNLPSEAAVGDGTFGCITLLTVCVASGERRTRSRTGRATIVRRMAQGAPEQRCPVLWKETRQPRDRRIRGWDEKEEKDLGCDASQLRRRPALSGESRALRTTLELAT